MTMPSHYRGTPREVRALGAFIKLSRAQDSLNGVLNQALVDEGVTPAQLGVLEALLHLGPLSASELGRALLRSNPNVSLVVDNLERDQLVRRERSDEDRRVVRVSLTPQGRRLIQRVFPGHARRVADLMGALTADEQEQLGRLCKKLGLAAQAARTPR
ncbi:MAG TPA: MarR family transcriptional regulator [Kofleriaceae bacterium]|nr:MarR family transcriptional regulator [Kofleriaceae bacterium]